MKVSISIQGFIFCLLLFLCNACRDEKPPLGFDKFKALLKDFHIAEAAVTTPGSPLYGATPLDSLPRLNALVLKQHGITEAQFREGLSWYKDHPEMLDSAYNAILSDLSVMQSRINK